MALSTGSSAIWSDIEAIYNTLRTVQSAHGLGQTANNGSQGSAIARDHIVTLYNAAKNTHDNEDCLKGVSWTNVTIPTVGTLITPGFINTIKTNIDNMSSVAHFQFSKFTFSDFNFNNFSFCFCGGCSGFCDGGGFN